MKNTLLITLVVLLVVLAAISGWAVGKFSHPDKEMNHSQRENELRLVVEGYTPTCDQLKVEGVHGPIKTDNNYLLVKVENNYFYVLGFNTDPGLPPVSWWWGASRESSLEQACKQP